MPASVEAAIIFALLIVPGYSLLAGYRLGREGAGPSRDLYVIAEAIVASVLMLAISWFRVTDLLDWIDQDSLDEHTGGALVLLLGLIVVPFLIGRALAEIIDRVASRADLQRHLTRLRLIPEGNAWQTAWARAREHGTLVVIDLKDGGGTIYGQMTHEGSVDLPPNEPALYLPVAYRSDDEGKIVRMSHGAYVHGATIAALYLEEPS